MFYNDLGEGVNGCYYDEDRCYSDGEYPRKSKAPSGWRRDPDYFHRKMFVGEEDPVIVHETSKALLISVKQGSFWVPKQLIRYRTGDFDEWKIYKFFHRKYIVDENSSVVKEHYTDGNEPIKCTECKSKNIKSIVKDTMQGTVCEELYECGDCGVPLGYWTYGYFDPYFKEAFIAKMSEG